MSDSDPGISDSDGSTPITAKEASALIRQVAASDLVRVLKRNEFAAARERVFAGFRVGLEGLLSPVARNRLANELVKDPVFAEALRAIAGIEEKPRAAPPMRGEPVKAQARETDRDKHVESDEKRRLKGEVASARDKIACLEKRIVVLEKSLCNALEQARILRAEAAAERGRDDWRERKIRRLEHEIAEARARTASASKAARGNARSENEAAGDRGIDPSSPRTLQADSAIVEAIERLIVHRKFEAADPVIEEVLRQNPADTRFRRLRASALIGRGSQAARDDLRFVFDQEIASGDLSGAARTLADAARAAGVPDERMARALFSALAKNRSAVPAVSEQLRALVGHASLPLLRSWCKAPLCEQLFEHESSDGELPLEFVRAVGVSNLTARSLSSAIDRGDVATVDSARAALAKMNKQVRDRVGFAVDRVATPSHFRLLARRELVGAAVVDASNVANYEREMMGRSGAALDNILAVREAVREAGYFPVLVVCDASLPFTIDRPEELRAMIGREEIEIVVSGTDADEVIVRDARRLGAIVVSNDYMADWDPSDEIEKVQFVISMTDGRASLFR
jgi:hypothetical protein